MRKTEVALRVLKLYSVEEARCRIKYSVLSHLLFRMEEVGKGEKGQMCASIFID